MRVLLAILCAVLSTGCATVGNDPVEMAKQDQAAAELGDVGAQYNLGVRYQNGMGVPKDDAEAVRWYRRAAEQGLSAAHNALGVMYNYGIGAAGLPPGAAKIEEASVCSSRSACA